MIGITSYGAYIPWHRMDRQLCLKAWGGFAIPGERSVAYYDEDSLTMAVESAINCLQDFDPEKVDGLFFATTTSPYKEKECAATMAIPLNLRRETRTADFNTSLRCATTAILMAYDSIKAGSLNNVLVTAADIRLASPSGMQEQGLGDGGAAFLLGNKNVIAEIIASHTISDDLAANWRADSDTFLRAWEDRMTQDEGYSKILPETVAALLEKAELTTKDLAKAVFDPPGDPRGHAKAVKDMGLEPGQVEDPYKLFMTVGLTGCAMAPMMLAHALEDAKPGDKILFAGYGNGCNAFIFQITDAITKLPERKGISKYLANKNPMEKYNDYLRWRKIIQLEAARRQEQQPIRVSAIWRERKQLMGLWGVKCNKCGTPQYDNGCGTTTPIRVCAKCIAQDDFEDYCFSALKAKVFSFTNDQLAPSIDPPSSVVLIEFEGGGRAFFDLTDRVADEIKIGMDIEMTFRKVFESRGISNYFWKARPAR